MKQNTRNTEIRLVKFAAFLLISLLIVTSCIQDKQQEIETGAIYQVKEIKPGILEGYLSDGMLPNSLELIPPPPTEGSVEFALDVNHSKKALSSDSLKVLQAVKDANLMFPDAIDDFSKIVGLKISEEKTPRLYMLMRRSMTDAKNSTHKAKNYYKRPRPFMLNNLGLCTPEEEKRLSHEGSYPSAHSATGWAWALILCEIFPDHTDALLKRGREFGENRMVCNAHWQSDVNEGRFMGAATVARLHANQTFRTDLAYAKNEVKNLRDDLRKRTSSQ